MESVTPTGPPANESEENPTHRVLLVVDEVFRGEDFASALRSHLGDKTDVETFVLAPAIAHNRIDQELGNIDPNLPEARERMETVISELHGAGYQATGQIGDADTLVAIGDGLRQFDADEIVVVSHIDGEAQSSEGGIRERLQTDYHQPVTHLRVGRPDGEDPPEVEEVERTPAHEVTEEDVIRETRNFPPMTNRDKAGILIGIVGTIALGMIALATGNKQDGEISGPAAIVLLIAIGAFLINVGHVVGLLFFESVRYHGIWEKFMARMSMFVTTVGLAVSLVLWLFVA